MVVIDIGRMAAPTVLEQDREALIAALLESQAAREEADETIELLTGVVAALQAQPTAPSMVTVTGIHGQRIHLSTGAIAEFTEASTSSQWHGIRAFIRTFDGRTIEVRETHLEIAAAMKGAAS